MMNCNAHLGALVPLLIAVALFLAGCGPADKGEQSKEKAKSVKDADSKTAKGDDKKDHDHGGWWCDEHGVPEEVCSMCSAKVASEFKKKGDWCQEHDRAMSQCFKCDPKLKDKFAAQYRAKYGKEPPPTEDEEKKDDKKKEEG